MDLPLIKKIKNEFSFVKKNFNNINRYQSFFNKDQLEINHPKNKKTKLNIIFPNFIENSEIIKDNFSKAKNSDIYSKYAISNITNKYDFNMLKKKNNGFLLSHNFISLLSPSKSSSKFNRSTFTKNINNSYNTIFISSDKNVYPSETRILKSNKSNPNFPLIKKKENKKIDKILTKFKLIKIISDNSSNNCFIQEKNNNSFYIRHKKRLLDSKFITNQINRHRRFIFDKKEHPLKELNNYLINIDISNSQRYNFSTEDIVKSLTNQEIKLIKNDVSYFKGINEEVIKELTKIKSKNICLIDMLNKEEEKKDINKVIKEPKKIIQANKKNENILYNYNNYLNKIINNDLTKRLKKIQIRNKKNEIENILNDLPSKINCTLGKLRNKKSKKVEDNCFRSFFSQINKDMRKEFSIGKNRERLIKEKSFQNIKKQKIKIKENEIKTIRECLEKYKKGLKKENEK